MLVEVLPTVGVDVTFVCSTGGGGGVDADICNMDDLDTRPVEDTVNASVAPIIMKAARAMDLKRNVVMFSLVLWRGETKVLLYYLRNIYSC